MDRRKLPVAALAAGLLLLILALSAGLLSLFCNTMYESDARKMGALTELYHEEEAAIAAIFNGKSFEAEAASDKNSSQSSISHSSDAQINAPENSGLAGSSRYEAEGKRLFEKYGYTLSSSIRSGSLWLYTAAMAAVLTAGVFLEVLLLIRMSRKTKAAADRAVFLEEKLQESHLCAEQMEEQLRREEQDTKALVTDISHQLKTPLASLKMSYELADSTDLSAEERREFAQKEREEVAKLESLLAVFTQLTRLETGMIQAIGMSEKQLMLMMQTEGLFYTLGTLAVSLGLGSLAGYCVFLYAKAEGMLNITFFHYPVIQAVILAATVTVVQLLLTYGVSRSFRRLSLIERIRYSE